MVAPVRWSSSYRGLLYLIISLIIGLSVVLSYEWWRPEPGSRADAPNIIFLGIAIGVILYVAARLVGEGGAIGRKRFCPACGRMIPFDANLCPYCGRRFE
jgi:predicted nucleic acid-binding Zn ribbon protein